jgi:putative membrane protein
LPPSEAERLLAGRYARGEIDTDEYMHRLAALRAEQR